MKGWKKGVVVLIILLVYLLTRLYNISQMNEYYDYDEGMYLLTARLITQGYLPYRDIFAVHPPMYYYSLAGWLWAFGDNYVTGRLFSVFLGAISIIIAYFVGKELRGWVLGLILALFLTLDPLLIHVNNLAFHETSIELFTLLSMYFFVKYIKSKNTVHAYLSLFWVGFGSTFKFTILPYSLALYILIFLYSSDRAVSSLHRMVSVLLNPRQLQIIIFTYFVMVSLVMATLILWPSAYVRLVFVVPGLHKISYYDQIISIMTLLVIWGIVTITVFRVSYLKSIRNFIKFVLSHLTQALMLAGAFLLPKVIIEGIFGIAVSREYIYQTYLIQGNRSFPLINIFGYIGNRFANIYKNSLEFWIFLTPVLIVAAIVLLLWIFSKKVPLSPLGREMVGLYVMSAIMYFGFSPSIVTERFILPLILLTYVLLGDILVGLSKKLKRERMHLVGFIVVMLLLIADFGILYQYPSGKLKFVYGEHTKTMRDDLKKYIEEHNINLTKEYALNPMNTYYLNAVTVPYYIDSFGLLLLNHLNSTETYSTKLFDTLREQGVKYFIISTWARLNWASRTLKNELNTFNRCVRENATLLYGESYSRGEVIELYSTRYPVGKGPLYVDTWQGTLVFWFNSTRLASIYLVDNETSFNYRTIVKYNISKGVYHVIQYNASKANSFVMTFNQTKVVISQLNGAQIIFNFTQPVPVVCEDELLKVNETISSSCVIYWNDVTFKVSGQNLTIKKVLNSAIEIKGKRIIFGITGQASS